jgi:hypothetical protein
LSAGIGSNSVPPEPTNAGFYRKVQGFQYVHPTIEETNLALN